MSATLSVDVMQKAAKWDEPDPAHVQYERKERELSSDKMSSRNGASQGDASKLKNADQSLICWPCNTDSNYTVAKSRSESQLTDHMKRVTAMQGMISTKYSYLKALKTVLRFQSLVEECVRSTIWEDFETTRMVQEVLRIQRY